MARSNFLEVKSVLNVVDEPDFMDFNIDAALPDFKSITPNPGFCVKAKTDDNEKLFINVCHSEDIPPPPESLDMNAILSNGGGGGDEESLFKFPLSLGEFHTELDKSGNECKCYDVVLNSHYYQEVSKSSVLRDFIMTLACSGLERKYNINIDVGTCTILNKRYHGKMPAHYIKLKSSTNSDFDLFDQIVPEKDEGIVMPVNNPARLIVTPDPEIPHFKLFQSPASGQASLIIFQGITKGIKNRKSIRVFVTKQKLIVRNPKGKIIISAALPFAVVPEQSLSNFWQNRLIVAMPVPCSD